MTASVAIISHNYGHYLREAIDSVLAQTLPPREILVIDDASTDSTADVASEYADRGVRYVRVENRNVWLNRLLAFRLLTSDWVLCLDADNTLPAEYLQRAVEIGSADPRCGIVYPMLQRFGDDDKLMTFDNYPPLPIANHVDAGAVWRREAILQTPLDDVQIDCSRSAEDWLLARRVTAAGWTGRRNTVPLNYRVHSEQKHTRRMTRTRNYYDDAALQNEPVTIVIPLSGRHHTWPMLSDWLESQTWPRHLCRLVLVDNSHSDQFGQMVREWLATSNYQHVSYSLCSAGHSGMADLPRGGRQLHNQQVNRVVAGIYNRAIREAATEYVLTIEDDVIPQTTATISELLQAMHPRTAAVSGAYKHRDQDKWLAWSGTAAQHTYPLAPRQGIEQIDGCGFGCLLLRKSALGAQQLTTDGPTIFYDCNASDQLRDHGWDIKVNWNVICDHHAGKL